MEVSPASGQHVGREAARALRAGHSVALAAPEQRDGGERDGDRGGPALGGGERARHRACPRACVLVGGETAFHVLDGLGHPPLAIESRPAPAGRARDGCAGGPHRGLPVVTKGGSTGEPGLLAALVHGLAAGAA